MKTTEQLVRDVFCKPICGCTYRHDCVCSINWESYAKAARRFVKMEQQQMSVDKLDDEIQRLMHLANSKERKHK